jgi:hypothetical protein
MQVEGRGQGDPLLAALGSSLVQFGINVNSAAQENDDGQVFSVFKVTTKDGKQVPKVRHSTLAQHACAAGMSNIDGRLQGAASTLHTSHRVVLANHSHMRPPREMCRTLHSRAKAHLLMCMHNPLCLLLQDQWDTVKRQVQELTASSQYSNQPAIYGMVAGAEAARLRGEVPGVEGAHCSCNDQ